MNEGTADEMEKYIAKLTQDTGQQMLEDRSFFEKLCVRAEGGATLLHEIAK